MEFNFRRRCDSQEVPNIMANKIEYQHRQPVGSYGCVFNRETAHKNEKRLAEFICSCGNIFESVIQSVKNGNTKSCGCRKHESGRRQILEINRFVNHGMSKSSEYKSWMQMKRRCMNSADKHFMDYGGRGISVCDRWIMSFEHFFEDMGFKPGPEYSIDRIDNDGNYDPNNCKWSNHLEQARNRRSIKKIEYMGKSMMLIEWSEMLGIPLKTLYDRIYRRKWPIDRVFTQPMGVRIKTK